MPFFTGRAPELICKQICNSKQPAQGVWVFLVVCVVLSLSLFLSVDAEVQRDEAGLLFATRRQQLHETRCFLS